MPARVSRQSIYIFIKSEGKKGRLSGKYDFHGLKNGAAAFVREGGKVDAFERFHPYYLMYQSNQKWCIVQHGSFEKGYGGGWLMIESKGLSEYLVVTHFKFVF